MPFCGAFFTFLLLTKCSKSTFSKKTGYFGTYGIFCLSELGQAVKHVKLKKVCAGLLLWSISTVADLDTHPTQSVSIAFRNVTDKLLRILPRLA